jgi:2-iminobutanoate/2-iminopropanoate deaminase
MKREAIFSSKASKPKGIYSPAIRAEGSFVFVSGQGPIDPTTNQMVLGDFNQQAELTLKNVGLLLEAAGTSWEHVVKVNVYLTNPTDFAAMNEIYKKFFKEPYPARTTVGTAMVSPGMLIEVDCVALVPGK